MGVYEWEFPQVIKSCYLKPIFNSIESGFLEVILQEYYRRRFKFFPLSRRFVKRDFVHFVSTSQYELEIDYDYIQDSLYSPKIYNDTVYFVNNTGDCSPSEYFSFAITGGNYEYRSYDLTYATHKIMRNSILENRFENVDLFGKNEPIPLVISDSDREEIMRNSVIIKGIVPKLHYIFQKGTNYKMLVTPEMFEKYGLDYPNP